MAEIYLQHPLHGQKVAHSVLEAQMDKANGWEEFEPNAGALVVPVEAEVVQPVAVDESVAGLPAFLTAPKGKKPKG